MTAVNTADIVAGRPAFVDSLVALYYEPRVKVETPTKRFDEGYGRHWRRCWVWFLEVGAAGPRNHRIHIDQFGDDWWELGVGCHCSCKQISIRSKTEPTDNEVLDALRLAGWPRMRVD